MTSFLIVVLIFIILYPLIKFVFKCCVAALAIAGLLALLILSAF